MMPTDIDHVVDQAPAEPAPNGDVGVGPDRDSAGRFVPGNKAALVVGSRSVAFWSAQADARREIEAAVIADAGHAVEDAPKALQIAAATIAQAVLVKDAAFLRLVESGGPMTSAGRTRRAYAVWLSATDRVERQLRLVGLKRLPKPSASPLDWIAGRTE
jgi:hypothetical protein